MADREPMTEEKARAIYDAIKAQADKGNPVAIQFAFKFAQAKARRESLIPVAEEFMAMVYALEEWTNRFLEAMEKGVGESLENISEKLRGISAEMYDLPERKEMLNQTMRQMREGDMRNRGV